MKTVLLEIPDDPALVPSWLEDQLVGEGLRELVSDLTAVHGNPPASRPALEAVFADQLEQVRESGLSVLNQNQVRTLLTHPALLWDLQEDLLTSGGEYWQSRLAENPLSQEDLDRGWDRLQTALSEDSFLSDPATTRTPTTPKVAWFRRPWLVSLATAAGVLLMVHFWDATINPPQQPTVATWGWDKPGALPQDVAADVYLNRLADAADQWFNKRPETRQALARRIIQFRQGCSTLILSEHKPLTPEDRQWLIEKCQAWAAKLDGQLTALEAGVNLSVVREASDETIQNLITALRKRAETVG